MDQKIELAIVKFFDARMRSRYGFAQPYLENGNTTGQPQIFFHYNDFGIVEVSEDDRVFISDELVPPSARPAIPRKGDMIAFVRASSSKHDKEKASPWVSADDYFDLLDKQIEDAEGEDLHDVHDYDDEDPTERPPGRPAVLFSH